MNTNNNNVENFEYNEEIGGVSISKNGNEITISSDSTDGGLFVGNSHSVNGGIKVINKESGEPILVEGGETIINKRSMSLDDKYVCEGTPRDITSKINELENGVSWSDEGSCKLVKKAEDGAEILEEANLYADAFGIIYEKNGVKYIITTSTKEQSENIQKSLLSFIQGDITSNEFNEIIDNYVGDSHELTNDIHIISGKPHVYDEHYKGYIELINSEPIKVNDDINMFALETNLDSFISEDIKQKGIGDYIISKGKKDINKDEIEKKLSTLNIEHDNLRHDFKHSLINQNEYYNEKRNLVKKYQPYLEAAKQYNVPVSNSIYVGITDMVRNYAENGKSISRFSKKPYPSISASNYPNEYKMEGNDGNIWEVSVNDLGIHKWKISEAKNGMSLKDHNKNFDNKFLLETIVLSHIETSKKNAESFYYDYENSLTVNMEDIYSIFSYRYYKNGQFLCNVFLKIDEFKAETQKQKKDSWDYGTERAITESSGYSVEYYPVHFKITEFLLEDGSKAEISNEDINQISLELNSIFNYGLSNIELFNLSDYKLTYSDVLDILKKSNIKKAEYGMKSCGCGCGIAEDGKEISSCGCNKSYNDGGNIDVVIQPSGKGETTLWHIINAKSPNSYVTNMFFDEKHLAEEYARKKGYKIVREFENKYADGGDVDNSYDYMMLGRLQSDNDYYLGYGNRNEKSLWAGNVNDQIEEMKRIWNKLKVKPEWLSMEDILEYEQKMKGQYADGGDVAARGKIIVTKISDIPNLMEELNEGRVTYRGLGMGKIYDDFYKIANEPGTRIKVKGKEYYITDSDFRKLNWDEKNKKWKNLIKFSAPQRRGYANGGGIESSNSDKLKRLGIKDTREFGNKYRDFLYKLEDERDGNYVGYKLDLINDELIFIQEKGMKTISILDYSEFPMNGTWNLEKDSILHYADGGGVENNATVIVISSEKPLSKQLGTTDWNDIYNSQGVSLVESNGKKYIVFTKRYIDQVDRYVIQDDISYIVKTYGISNVEWDNLSDKRYALEMSKNEYNNGGSIKSKKIKGDIGKSGTQYGYTLAEWETMAKKKGLLVSPKQWWKSREGKEYTDSFGRKKKIGQYSGDERQEMQMYGYLIANGLDLGSKIIPLSAKKYVEENNYIKYENGGGVENVDTLELVFKTTSNYLKAKKHFENISDFYPYEYNEEFKTIFFNAYGQEDADSLEFYIDQELQETDITDYHFESSGSKLQFSNGGNIVNNNFYALTSDGMRNKKKQKINLVSYWKGKETNHAPTLENIKEFLSQVPFDESIAIYTNSDEKNNGELHSAYTPLYIYGAKSVDAIVDENDNIIWNKYEGSKYVINPKNYMSNGGDVDNVWIVLSKTNNGLLLSERFLKPITNLEVYSYYKDKGYEIVDSNIFKVTNKDVLDVFMDAISKFIEEIYNEEVDWDNTLLSYKIVDNKIIAEESIVITKNGNEYKVTPNDLVGNYSNGGGIDDTQYLILSFKNTTDYNKAKEHFVTESDFFPSEFNNEFNSIYFDVDGQDDADSLEKFLDEELLNNNISGYYFESSYSNGGSLDEDFKIGDWVKEKKGNARGKIWEIFGSMIKLEDVYGNKENKYFYAKNFKHSSKPRYENGGGIDENINDKSSNLYFIFEGYDHYNSYPLYRVESTSINENEYVGEWHKSKKDAIDELNYLNKKYENGGGIDEKHEFRTDFEINERVFIPSLKKYGIVEDIIELRGIPMLVIVIDNKLKVKMPLIAVQKITNEYSNGGKIEKLIAPEGYVFSKILSHRASDKIDRLGVKYISLYSFGKGGSASTMDIFLKEEDYNEIKNIVGVSESKKTLIAKSEIFARNEDEELKKVFKTIIQKYADGGITSKQKSKIGKVMHEWKEGKLHIGKSDKIVKDQKQAVAIALSEAGLSKKENGAYINYAEHDYQIYHNTLASVLNEIENYIQFFGYEKGDYFPPIEHVNYGTTFKTTLELLIFGEIKNNLNIQIYRMDSGRYELNMYPDKKFKIPKF